MMGMDSSTLWLVIVPLILGLVFNAAKFMRFVGFVASGGKRSKVAGRSYQEQMSFDDRVAERLRELERDRNRVE